jgi:hypothetical protein
VRSRRPFPESVSFFFGGDHGDLPDVVPMPVEKVGRAMYGRGHIHMDDNEVVISVFGAGVLARRKLARFRKDALHRPNVLLPLIFRQVATFQLLITKSGHDEALHTIPFGWPQCPCYRRHRG